MRQLFGSGCYLGWYQRFSKALATVLVAVLLLSMIFPAVLMLSAQAQSVSELQRKNQSIQSKRNYLRKKKQEAQRQANTISGQIIHNQRKLDTAQHTLKRNQHDLTQTRSELSQLNMALEETRREHDVVYNEAKRRVRRIYTTGRTNMLLMLLDAKDIPSFMDRLTYKRYIVKRDRNLLALLEAKEQEYQNQLNEKRRKELEIDQTIRSIESLRGSISDRLLHDKKLRERYWKDAKAYERAERDLLAESRKLESEIKSMTSDSSGGSQSSQATGGFAWPLRGTITSKYGYRRHPIHRKRLMHTGLDIAKGHGSPVHASNSGTVIYSGWRGGYGKVVMVNHGKINGKNVVTLYAHLSATLANKGAHVSKGQTIGKVGSTGYATGPHLHFEVRENGKTVNPMGYL